MGQDDELLARWTQLGLWSPILRLHSTNNPFLSRAPWLRSPECQSIMTQALQFRHKLIPYLYTMSVRATQTNQQLVEPMYYDHPNSPEAYRNKNQYLFGSELVVSPITQRKGYSTDMGSVETWLPAGRYVDLFTGLVYDGDRVIKTFRSTDKTPVFAREGSIVPLDNSSADGHVRNGAPIPEAIELIVVVGKSGKFELLEDDGKAEDIESITFAKTEISFDQDSGRISISATKDSLFKERTWSIRLPALEGDSKSLDNITAKIGSSKVDTKVKREEKTGAVIIKLTDPVSSTKETTIELGTKPKLQRNDIKTRALQILDRGQVDHDLKWRVWEHFEQKGLSHNIFLSRLKAFGLDQDMLDALLEVVLAQD
jgi:alpha-glucosidase (family GH31 glycosyl hydrolase)